MIEREYYASDGQKYKIEASCEDELYHKMAEIENQKIEVGKYIEWPIK